MNFNDKFYEYYALFEKARQLEKEKNEDESLKIYLNILKKYQPLGTAYYERPAIILEKQKQYKEAIKVCERAILAIENNLFNASKNEFEHRLNRLIEKMNKTNKLNKPVKTSAKNNSPSTEVTIAPTTDISEQIVNFPNWYVSISFGVSKSQSYPQAIALAKMAPQYIENNIDGKILNQAIYSDSPKEYLQFIKLYELISQWKSCFVVINGEIIDRKIIGGLNYCYGDRCRSGKSDFCFGASPLTANPFGCHRLQISQYNNPWWSFGYYDIHKVWHIDKDSILRRIEEFSMPYKMCPCFSIENANTALSSLPNEINPSNDSGWTISYDSIQPSNYNVVSNHTISLSLDTCADTSNTNKKLDVSFKKKGLFSSLISAFKK